MRFLKDGPSIPDELLFARDEGRVVFFCGSGVSRAKANLSDYFGLAEDVLTSLRVPSDHATRTLLSEAKSVENRTGIAGLISADRVFALLERDFERRDVQRAVAEALRTPDNVDLSAHQIITDLAKSENGGLRLVTTNFDRLFESSCAGLPVWCSPRLPDPSRPNEMSGLIYLHGRVTEDYSGAESNGFILSTSEFGRAYLSEGWATQFVRAVIERYVVVFVGYSADDPPIQYLLEALSTQGSPPHGAYAFQEGVSSEAKGRWIHKGVRAIAYRPGANHSPLWETLAEWAKRARDPRTWYQTVIRRATEGPQSLEPYERGQVAHIISTVEGARLFGSNDPPPPATWLCTLDPRQRYTTPSSVWAGLEPGPTIDPFGLFGLDSDEVPEQPDPEQSHRDRRVPDGAWNGLVANRRDLVDAPEDHAPWMYGVGSSVASRLPTRLQYLGEWIAQVAGQPAAPWWAIRKGGLHPTIRQRIKWQMELSGEVAKPTAPSIRKVWHYLIDSWDEPRTPDSRDWYELKARIAIDGWDLNTARKFGDHFRPYLSVKPAVLGSPIPPALDDDFRLGEIAHLDIEYPEAHDAEQVPPAHLRQVVKLLRQNLELATCLEEELGGRGIDYLSPINADDDPKIDRYGRSHGLSGAMIYFSDLFKELVTHDHEAAAAEFRAWPDHRDGVFARLRVWAAANPVVATDQEFASALANLSDELFWDSSFQRDLLLSVSSRWPRLSAPVRSTIEARLLKDERDWEGFDSEQVERRKAWNTLSRLTWLRRNGCDFGVTVRAEEERLQTLAPDWTDTAADKAVTSVEGRGGTVRTDTTYDMLLSTDLANTLEVAETLQGRTDDFLVEADPFQGLAANRPARAFGALMRAVRDGKYVEWAWRAFLSTEVRRQDSGRLVRLIAERLASFPDESLSEFVRAASSWLRTVGGRLAQQSQPVFDRIILKLCNVIAKFPEKAGTALVRGNRRPDWVTEAINSPAGKIAETLMDDPRKNDLQHGQGFDGDWKTLAEQSLGLPSDHGCYALVIYCYNLSWFYAIDRAWAIKHLVSAVESAEDLRRDAFWSGFLWGARVPYRELFVVLKPHLLRFAIEGTFERRGTGDILAGMLLAGWGSVFEGERLVSDEEMQRVLLAADEAFRSKVLRNLRIWIARPQGEEASNWRELAPTFFETVWPRQKFVRTAAISSNLVDLMFEDSATFATLVTPVLPLLTTIEASNFTTMPSLRSEARNPDVVEQHPELVLEVLYAVLSEDVREWPYEADKVLERVADADANLRKNPKFVELTRRWNSR